MRSIAFIAMLFCMALSALLVGGMNLYETVDFHWNGRSALMDFPEAGKKKVALPTASYELVSLDVRYTGADGELAVPQKRLSGREAQKLVAGEKVPITYLKHNPHQVFHAGTQPESPWAWLVVGGAAMAVFAYALKLKRNEAELLA